MVYALTRYYRGDPDRIKAKTFDVVELRLQTTERTSTVVTEVAAGITTGVTTATSNSICQDEIDAARLPSIGVCC